VEEAKLLVDNLEGETVDCVGDEQYKLLGDDLLDDTDMGEVEC